MNKQLNESVSNVLKSATELAMQRLAFDDFLLSPYVAGLDVRDFKFLTHLCLLGGTATRETMKNSTSMDGMALNNCIARLMSKDLVRKDEESTGSAFTLNPEMIEAILSEVIK